MCFIDASLKLFREYFINSQTEQRSANIGRAPYCHIQINIQKRIERQTFKAMNRSLLKMHNLLIINNISTIKNIFVE